MLKNSKNNLIMTKAVLFDFDETLQDRTKAFEKYAYAFLDEFCPICRQKKEKNAKRIWRTQATAVMSTVLNGVPNL